MLECTESSFETIILPNAVHYAQHHVTDKYRIALQPCGVDRRYRDIKRALLSWIATLSILPRLQDGAFNVDKIITMATKKGSSMSSNLLNLFQSMKASMFAQQALLYLMFMLTLQLLHRRRFTVFILCVSTSTVARGMFSTLYNNERC